MPWRWDPPHLGPQPRKQRSATEAKSRSGNAPFDPGPETTVQQPPAAQGATQWSLVVVCRPPTVRWRLYVVLFDCMSGGTTWPPWVLTCSGLQAALREALPTSSLTSFGSGALSFLLFFFFWKTHPKSHVTKFRISDREGPALPIIPPKRSGGRAGPGVRQREQGVLSFLFVLCCFSGDIWRGGGVRQSRPAPQPHYHPVSGWCNVLTFHYCPPPPPKTQATTSATHPPQRGLSLAQRVLLLRSSAPRGNIRE